MTSRFVDRRLAGGFAAALSTGIAALALAGCQVERDDAPARNSADGAPGDLRNESRPKTPAKAETVVLQAPVAVPEGEAVATAPARIIDEPRIPPLDTCRKTGSFPAFRQKFETAVAQRDFALLEPLVDYDLETDFGDDDEGMKAFANRWRGASWQTSKLWDELDAIIALGCGGSEGYFAMPRMFVVDTGEVDPFEALVALGDAVPLRSGATGNADVIALLDWALVTAVSPGARDTAWIEVRTADGTRGFVKRELLRSPIDYRAVFQPRKGDWKLTAFIAGD